MSHYPDGKSFVEDCVHSKGIAETAERVCDEAIRVMKTTPAGVRCSGYTTDNTNTMKAAWKLIEEAQPGSFCQGCVCHVANLAVNDMNNRIPWMKEVVDIVKDIIFFVYRHHSVLCELKRLNNPDDGPKTTFLVKPCKTRWGTTNAAVRSVLVNEVNLLKIFDAAFVAAGRTEEDRVKRRLYRRSLSDPVFIGQLKRCVLMMEPWCAMILRFETEHVEMSDVYEAFEEMKATIADMEGISEEDRVIMEQIRAERYVNI